MKLWNAAARWLPSLALVWLCLATRAQAQQPADWVVRPPVGKVEKRVLALYYPWYQTPAVSGKWAHQDGVESANKRMVSHTHYPAGGPYDSADPKVIERHLSQAKAAGIDTLVCSWWGRQDPTDRAIKLLIDRAPAHGLTVCIYWERLQPKTDRLAAVADLSYLLQTFGGKPAYLRQGGKPVVFLYAGLCRSLSPADWEQALATVHERIAAKNQEPGTSYRSGFVAIGAGDRLADAMLWDGLNAVDIDGPMPERNAAGSAKIVSDRFRPANALAHRLGHVAVETILPGYDDRKPNATSAIPRRNVVDRESGELYRALWRHAIADAPDWVLVYSFNQWHNGTEIEPSVEMGDAYLHITAEMAGKFKR